MLRLAIALEKKQVMVKSLVDYTVFINFQK